MGAYPTIERGSKWPDLEEHVSGLGEKEYEKCAKQQTQTSRESLAASFTTQLREAVENTKG